MKCEEARQEIMEQPIGLYSGDVDQHLQTCKDCEKLYLQVRALESSFKLQALVRPGLSLTRSFYPMTIIAVLAIYFLLPSMENNGEFVPMNIDLHLDSRKIASRVHHVTPEGSLTEGQMDPWTALDYSFGDGIDQLLGRAADEAFDTLQESHLEELSDMMQADEVWDVTSYLEG